MDLLGLMAMLNCSYQIYYNPMYDELLLMLMMVVKIVMIAIVKIQMGALIFLKNLVLMIVERAQLLALLFHLMIAASLLEMKLVYIHVYALHITIKTLEFHHHNI